MKLPDIVNIAVHVRLAQKTDLLIAPGCLRIHQPYYLYSHQKQRFEGLYVITNQTNSQELKAWFRASMVYVPINVLENNIVVIPETTKNQDAA